MRNQEFNLWVQNASPLRKAITEAIEGHKLNTYTETVGLIEEIETAIKPWISEQLALGATLVKVAPNPKSQESDQPVISKPDIEKQARTAGNLYVDSFDLKAALAGEKVVTRNGIEVPNMGYFPTASVGCQIAAQINGVVHLMYADGRADNDGSLSHFDLFMASKKTTLYFALWVTDLNLFTTKAFIIHTVRHDWIKGVDEAYKLIDTFEREVKL